MRGRYLHNVDAPNNCPKGHGPMRLLLNTYACDTCDGHVTPTIPTSRAKVTLKFTTAQRRHPACGYVGFGHPAWGDINTRLSAYLVQRVGFTGVALGAEFEWVGYTPKGDGVIVKIGAAEIEVPFRHWPDVDDVEIR
jgi:hypothetical protein